jgi:aspartyl-tRNA(Asn)/glutamyl-tRNA(Gln) amidotransferase subunit A
MELPFITAVEAARRIARGELTPVDLRAALDAQVERLEPRLNCFITVCHDQPAPAVGPLRGVPIAVKDNIETAGVRSTGGSKILADHVPAADAPAWARLKAAGAVLQGKTNLHELGMGATNVNPHHGPTHNPWDVERIPGGSSGGTAAAVAAGLALAGLGTDAGGSVRIPAALCGIVGLKQTHGLVPVRGGIGFGNPTVDHIGPMARSVEDVALLLSVMAGHDRFDPTSVRAPWAADYGGSARRGAAEPDLRGRRVGVPTSFYFDDVEAGVAAAVRAAIDLLGTLGADVVDVALPDHDALMAGVAGLGAEAVVHHAKWMRTRFGDYGEDLQVRLLAAQLITGEDYAKALRARRLLKERYAAALASVDLIAAPTVPIAAPRIADARDTFRMNVLSRNTRASNLTGLPAISVPCGFAEGLPVGLQLIARPFAEETLLHAAAAYEAATDWHTRVPPLAA